MRHCTGVLPAYGSDPHCQRCSGRVMAEQLTKKLGQPVARLHAHRLSRGRSARDHGQQAVGLKTYADFEAFARKEGRIDFGSGGPGSIGHIHGELLKQTAGINMVHVPYRGGDRHAALAADAGRTDHDRTQAAEARA